MHTVILFCAVMFASDPAASVQAKVLYGTSADQQHRADMELWISQAVAKTGSPLTQPYTGWIDLTDKSQRLHSANGLYIDGMATVRNGKYEVEIEGCNGGSLDQNVMLKPGERRVVNLSGNLGSGNLFVALAAPVSDKAKQRAKAMKADAKTFHLELNYNGQEDKPFYHLIVSVPVVGVDRSNPFYRIVQVNQEEATRIIDHLARDGFLDSAVDLRNKIKLPPPTMPGYTMKVVTGDIPLYEDLGWGLPLITRLDALRVVLHDQGKKDMELLLGRLSGLRKQWEADQAGKKSLKGWEVYVWDDDGVTKFSLMAGTNRLKFDEDIAAASVEGVEAIKAQLNKLEKGQSVFLHGRRLSDSATDALSKPVVEYCEEIGLSVE